MDTDQDDKGSWLLAAGSALEEAILDSLQSMGRNLSEPEVEELTEKILQGSIKGFIASLAVKQSAHLHEVRKDLRAFNRRNESRWKRAFDALEALWQVCSEIGGEFNRHYRPAAVTDNDYQFEALASLHAKALLVTRECLALMQQGFAEGALARWRTLHEIAATALLIQQSDQQVALRYLATFRFQALRAASQINSLFGFDTRESFSQEELVAMEAECARLTKQFGTRLNEEYEWARSAILGLHPNSKVTFRDIEAATNQGDFRPYYRWASQHNHGGYRPPDKGLGLVESTSPTLLIGPSNSGMVDPLQLVALSLAKASVALLTSRVTLDTAIWLSVVDHFSRSVGPIALKVEKKTLERARRRQQRVATESEGTEG